MRAAVFKRALGRLVVEQHPDPSPEAGELLIRIARAGICGSEIHATSHPARPVGGDTILGHEICGVVVPASPASRTCVPGHGSASLPVTVNIRVSVRTSVFACLRKYPTRKLP